jgi:dienelactone hydrolase
MAQLLKLVLLGFFPVFLIACVTPKADLGGSKVDFVAHTYFLKNLAPTVLIAHGCDGPNNPSYRDWARQLNSWGFNAILVDSFTARGISNLCGVGAAIPWSLRAKDFMDLAVWVRKQPLHRGGVGVVGFSQGGSTVLALGNERTLELFGGFNDLKNLPIQAMVAYYPRCQLGGVPPEANPAIPTMIHLGGKDDWTPPAYCNPQALTHRFYSVYLYPNATHAFDMNLPPRKYLDYFLSYDPEADRLSRIRTKEFLEKLIR